MDLQLTNKKALVTGSTAGIGFAIAALLAQEGAPVVVSGLRRRTKWRRWWSKSAAHWPRPPTGRCCG